MTAFTRLADHGPVPSGNLLQVAYYQNLLGTGILHVSHRLLPSVAVCPLRSTRKGKLGSKAISRRV